MAYILTHTKKDGSREVRRVMGRLNQLLERRDVHGNLTFSEDRLPADTAVRQHRASVNLARKEDRASNGFTKGRIFRRVARIPKEAAVHMRRSGIHAKDRRDLKAFIKGQGFNTVPADSF